VKFFNSRICLILFSGCSIIITRINSSKLE
jgi:uncharacterized protein YceK